jgi:two-component system cell cycle response regulator DivK
LRAQPRTAPIRVVALTAFAMRDDRERLLGEGFDGYVEKPIDVKRFPAQVQALLRGTRRTAAP